MILDLSSPQGFSVNHGISKESSSISYTTTDYGVEAILKSGKGTLMVKLDIKQAYRNIPVHPTDHPLLGVAWDGKVYADKTLPFGLRSATVLLSAMANALGWIMSKNGVPSIVNYRDNFLTLGNPFPAPLPAALLDLLLLFKPDWTSWSWTELWNDIFTKD